MLLRTTLCQKNCSLVWRHHADCYKNGRILHFFPHFAAFAFFDKFYQKSNIHTRQEGGTGLGLAIAKGIIEAHGGNLWIGDGENGVGSNFQFTLPI